MHKFDPFDALVPIFLETHVPVRMHQIGTGVFIHFLGHYCLFTAAHVTDESKQGELMVPTSEGIVPIEGYLQYIDLPPELKRIDDHADMACYKLSPSFVEIMLPVFKPIEKGGYRIIPDIENTFICSAAGYPTTKARRDGDLFTSEHYCASGLIESPERYAELGLSRTNNIVFRFDRKNAVRPDGTDFLPPKFNGISGGGIFAWPTLATYNPDWMSRILIGIVHTYKERESTFIGTSLVPYVAAIGLGEMKSFGGI